MEISGVSGSLLDGNQHNRPLFLTQLALLYQRSGELPPLAADVYERIVRLSVEDWNKDQGIHRTSKYSQFGPDRQIKFLCALSYELTFKFKLRVFSRRNLAEAYQLVSFDFGLPPEQATEVARELETHTGLVVRSAEEKFEFSHLSLQEFLCADQITREPFPERLQDYLAENPAPLAIATAISPKPDQFFSGLLLKEGNLSAFGEEAFHAYLERLSYESPVLRPGPILGLAILQALSYYSEEKIHRLLRGMIDKYSLWNSLYNALKSYFGYRLLDHHVQFARKAEVANLYGYSSPIYINLEKTLVVDIVNITRHTDLVWSVSGTTRYPIVVTAAGEIEFKLP